MAITISSNGKVEYIVTNREDAIAIIQGYQREDFVDFDVDWGDQLSPSEERWAEEADLCFTTGE